MGKPPLDTFRTMHNENSEDIFETLVTSRAQARRLPAVADFQPLIQLLKTSGRCREWY